MPKRRIHTRSKDEPQPAPPASQYRTEHYGSRNFAVYEGKELIAVTLYRKGAKAITAHLEEKDRTIAALQSQLATVPQAPAPSPPSLTESVTAPVWRPPQQLPLIAEDLTPYRITSPRRRAAHAPRRS